MSRKLLQNVTNLKQHIVHMRTTRPPLALLYFKNSSTAECSSQLDRDLYSLTSKYPTYKFFQIDYQIGTPTEKVKRYYKVIYEPTFLLLAHGTETDRIIGSDMNLLEQKLNRLHKFLRNVDWNQLNVSEIDKWEDYTDQWYYEFREIHEREFYLHDGQVCFDK